jgi:hypothetical protein
LALGQFYFSDTPFAIIINKRLPPANRVGAFLPGDEKVTLIL